MSEIQDRWNEYYADKRWIDTKGWCHLDGTPYSFIELEKQSDQRVSFLKTILKTIFYRLILMIVTVVCLKVFFENTHTMIAIIYNILRYVLVIRCIWIIIKNLFKKNLKFW